MRSVTGRTGPGRRIVEMQVAVEAGQVLIRPVRPASQVARAVRPTARTAAAGPPAPRRRCAGLRLPERGGGLLDRPLDAWRGWPQGTLVFWTMALIAAAAVW